jgi:Sec-independent protein translocase protein TatA
LLVVAERVALILVAVVAVVVFFQARKISHQQ